MDKKILFICTGNTCRSPMAKVLAEHYFENRGITDIEIDSAGVSAYGEEANENSIIAVSEIAPALGKRLENHRSKMISAEDVLSADRIFVMSRRHADVILSIMEEYHKNVHSEFDEETQNALLSKITVLNVPDPYGSGIELYRKTRDWLIELIDEFYKPHN